MPDRGDFDIDHVATLARIALTAEERAKFESQLGDVLAYIAQLKEVDVSGVEATAHAFPVVNVWADDVAQAGLPIEAALRNAPARDGALFVVPQVVE